MLFRIDPQAFAIALQQSEELEKLSDEVRPSMPEEEIAYIKRDAERRITEIEEANAKSA